MNRIPRMTLAAALLLAVLATAWWQGLPQPTDLTGEPQGAHSTQAADAAPSASQAVAASAAPFEPAPARAVARMPTEASDAERSRTWCTSRNALALQRAQAFERFNAQPESKQTWPEIEAALTAEAAHPELLASAVEEAGKRFSAHLQARVHAQPGDATAQTLALLGQPDALRQRALQGGTPLALFLAHAACGKGADEAACARSLLQRWLQVAPQAMEPWLHAADAGLVPPEQALDALAAAQDGGSQRLAAVDAWLRLLPLTQKTGLAAEGEIEWLRSQTDGFPGMAFKLMAYCKVQRQSKRCQAAAESLWQRGEETFWRRLALILAGTQRPFDEARWGPRADVLEASALWAAQQRPAERQASGLGACDPSHRHNPEALRAWLPEPVSTREARLPPPGPQRDALLAQARAGKSRTFFEVF